MTEDVAALRALHEDLRMGRFEGDQYELLHRFGNAGFLEARSTVESFLRNSDPQHTRRTRLSRGASAPCRSGGAGAPADGGNAGGARLKASRSSDRRRASLSGEPGRSVESLALQRSKGGEPFRRAGTPPPAPQPRLGAPPAPLHNGTAYWIKVLVQADGSFTVKNTRNGFSKTYNASLRPGTN
jgi:hypothetical protein